MISMSHKHIPDCSKEHIKCAEIEPNQNNLESKVEQDSQQNMQQPQPDKVVHLRVRHKCNQHQTENLPE